MLKFPLFWGQDSHLRPLRRRCLPSPQTAVGLRPLIHAGPRGSRPGLPQWCHRDVWWQCQEGAGACGHAGFGQLCRQQRERIPASLLLSGGKHAVARGRERVWDNSPRPVLVQGCGQGQRWEAGQAPNDSGERLEVAVRPLWHLLGMAAPGRAFSSPPGAFPAPSPLPNQVLCSRQGAGPANPDKCDRFAPCHSAALFFCITHLTLPQLTLMPACVSVRASAPSSTPAEKYHNYGGCLLQPQFWFLTGQQQLLQICSLSTLCNAEISISFSMRTTRQCNRLPSPSLEVFRTRMIKALATWSAPISDPALSRRPR